MSPVERLDFTENGIVNGFETQALRQVLILPKTVLQKFNVKAGDLGENIVIEGIDIHSLTSGTVIQIGKAKIRLTYHCEPCKRIAHKVSMKDIVHQRGYLGSFLNTASIAIGDQMTILGKQFEAIPYDIKDRIRWYLDRVDKAVTVKELTYQVGLSHSYCRAIPNMLKKMDCKYRELVDYPSKYKIE